jgi:Transposase
MQPFYLCHWLSHDTPPRRSYHDRQCAAKMKEIGLQPSTTAEPGGKETGQSVTRYILPGSPMRRPVRSSRRKGFNFIGSRHQQGNRRKQRRPARRNSPARTARRTDGQGQALVVVDRWISLSSGKRQGLNSLFTLNRKLFKAYVLKESLDRLWNYRYEGAMLNYLLRWMDQLRWQRLRPFESLAEMLLNPPGGHLELLPHQSPPGNGGGHQRKIKMLVTPRPWV